jgi:hypothetical protein
MKRSEVMAAQERARQTLAAAGIALTSAEAARLAAALCSS